MKKSILFALFLFISSIAYCQGGYMTYKPATANYQTSIDNGVYVATVQYYNPKTYTKSTYTLKVTVSYDNVVLIDFGNGGSVHSGYNNEGYIYSGGYLTYNHDTNGNITSATGIVKVTYRGEYTPVTFQILIE